MTGASQLVDGALTPGFLFPAISVCCLPACHPFPGNFPGSAGNFLGKEGKQGARWEGAASVGAQEADILLLPRVSGSYFLINWECCLFAGDFQMFPFSSRQPRGCILHGYGNYCRQWGGGHTPAMMGRGSIRAPYPTMHPGVASCSSSLPAPSPWPLVLPPAGVLLPWGQAGGRAGFRMSKLGWWQEMTPQGEG